MANTSYNVYQQLTSVKLASTENISGFYKNGKIGNGVGATLTSTSEGSLIIDGISVNVDDRILLWQQTNSCENGIYIVNSPGDQYSLWQLERSNDFQSLEQVISGQYLSVNSGNVNSGSMFVLIEPLPRYIGRGDTGFVFFNVGAGSSPDEPQDLQDTYDTGENAIVTLLEDRPITIQNITIESGINAIIVPGTGNIPPPGNNRVLGWTFTPDSDITIYALQYEDALIESDLSRETGIFDRDTQELLGSVEISNQDPLDSTNIFRTATLSTPIECKGGHSYVWATVAPKFEHDHQPTCIATPHAGIVISERWERPASSNFVFLTFPLDNTVISNFVYLGSFVYDASAVVDSVNINDSGTNPTTIFSVNSTIRASIPAPVMEELQRDAIVDPELGSQVFVSDTSPPALYLWDGSAWSTGNSSVASELSVTNTSTNSSFFIPIITNSVTGDYSVYVGAGLTFNPSTNTVTATTFAGALSGNATTATTASQGATVSTTTNANYFPLFVASSSNGNQAFNLSDKWQFNPSTGVLNVGATQSQNGVGKLRITGTNGSASGPHQEFYTAADAYPLMQNFLYTHDNMGTFFDCYFDNTITLRSSSANGNFWISKGVNVLSFAYSTGSNAQGASLAGNQFTGFFLDSTGDLNINKSIKLVNTSPPSTPTGGPKLYGDSGAAKVIGTSGTVTTFGPAEPHCPICDSDFGFEWQNEKYGGNLRVCMKCFSDEVGHKKWIRWNE